MDLVDHLDVNKITTTTTTTTKVLFHWIALGTWACGNDVTFLQENIMSGEQSKNKKQNKINKERRGFVNYKVLYHHRRKL